MYVAETVKKFDTVEDEEISGDIGDRDNIRTVRSLTTSTATTTTSVQTTTLRTTTLETTQFEE